jgi:hypothetical protein
VTELTYDGLCTVRACPYPNDPEWHQCFICLEPRVHHHHVESRSQAPSRVLDGSNLVPLCYEHHELVTKKEWRDEINDRGEYVAYDEKGEVRCRVMQDTGDIAEPSMVELMEVAVMSSESHRAVRFERSGPTGTFTEVSWEPPAEGLDYDEWAALLRSTARMGRSWQLWIGDQLNYGEHAYGEKYTQAASETGLDEATLMNCASVAGRVQRESRRGNLSFTHHRAVAALPPTKQKELLALAEPLPGKDRPQMSTRELEAAVKGAAIQEAKECVHELQMVCKHCGRKFLREPRRAEWQPIPEE